MADLLVAFVLGYIVCASKVLFMAKTGDNDG